MEYNKLVYGHYPVLEMLSEYSICKAACRYAANQGLRHCLHRISQMLDDGFRREEAVRNRCEGLDFEGVRKSGVSELVFRNEQEINAARQLRFRMARQSARTGD